MPGQQDSKDPNLNSAVNLWQEAVEKAGVDLEKIVQNTVDQLSRYCEELEKSLGLQLDKVASEATSSLENRVDELSVRGEALQDGVREHKRAEANRILEHAQEARASIRALVANTKKELREEVSERLKELTTKLQDPRGQFEDLTERQKSSLKEHAESGAQRIASRRRGFEESLDERAQEIEKEIDGSVSASRRMLDAKMYEYSSKLDTKIKEVLEQLDSTTSDTKLAFSEATQQGVSLIEESQRGEGGFVLEQIDEWKDSVQSMRDSFQSELKEIKEESFTSHTKNLHMEVSEGKLTIEHIASDAEARLTGNHRAYKASLERLERKYEDELRKLFGKLESVISDERDMPQTSHAPISTEREDEMRRKLRADLEVRGSELVKTYRRQGEQMESDFSRITSVSTERVEGIRLQAVESLDKQVRMIRGELDRINKSFGAQLSHLTLELPEIEERGRVAAMSVSAYLASMLTLETDFD